MAPTGSDTTTQQQQQEKPPEEQRERKLSTASDHAAEPRLRTRSFSKNGQQHVCKEFVGDRMDQQLQRLNLVKKNMPMDGTSIFRAVCEQISSVQTDHQELRKLVETMLTPIAQRHYNAAELHHTSKYDRDKSIFEILSNITSSRIKVYRATSDEPEVFECDDMVEDRVIQVCETRNRGVYDSVYSGEMHEALAYSQSIVYNMLYEGVFKCAKQEIKDMIKFIREDNDKHAHATIDEMFMMEDHRMHSMNALCASKPPKFPYCACKSLAPEIYRNVEYALSRKKAEESEQAARNSLAVKFGYGAQCLARDGGKTRPARVVSVISHDSRLVKFEDLPSYTREFNVSDLRALTSVPVTHHSLHTLMHGTTGRGGGGGGGKQQMAFLPGCMNQPPMSPMQHPQHQQQLQPPFPGPPFSSPSQYGMPPPSLQLMGGPPPSPPVFSPDHMMAYNGPQPQHFFGPRDMLQPSLPPLQQLQQQMGPQPPPPLLPMHMQRESSGHSSSSSMAPQAGDSPSDTSSVFPATPLSSRRPEEGRRGKKPRALSMELTDSPTAGRPGKWEPTWNKNATAMVQQKEVEAEKRRGGGGRRATEGDVVAEMNRPLQPKQHRLSTCDSVPENEFPLPSLMDTPSQLMQQLQLHERPAPAAGAAHAKLPSLLPRPRDSYYESSEFMGSDTVFKDGEGTASQTSLVNTHDAPLLSSTSTDVPQPLQAGGGGGVVMAVAGGVPDSITFKVPFISVQEFQEGVNPNAEYSQNVEGADLPDTMTTRFFYNLGLAHFKNDIMQSVIPPPADALPMPPQFIVSSPSPMPLAAPGFFQGHFNMFHQPSAPPPTPALMTPATFTMPPHLMQYCNPGVEGMPIYGYGIMADDGRGGGGGGQMMEQGQMNAMPSPSPMMGNGQDRVFFPN